MLQFEEHKECCDVCDVVYRRHMLRLYRGDWSFLPRVTPKPLPQVVSGVVVMVQLWLSGHCPMNPAQRVWCVARTSYNMHGSRRKLEVVAWTRSDRILSQWLEFILQAKGTTGTFTSDCYSCLRGFVEWMFSETPPPFSCFLTPLNCTFVLFKLPSLLDHYHALNDGLDCVWCTVLLF